MAEDTSSPAAQGGFAETLDKLLNKGVDVAVQLASAKLNQPKTTVVTPTTSANAASKAAAAGSATAGAATASKLPTWVLPTVIGVAVLGVVGLLFGLLRRGK